MHVRPPTNLPSVASFFFPRSTSPGESDNCQLLSRKRRRGVIEKKRRDRINSSLTELKRLVPSAYEKQGSAKLEKAEILQLTVDHLKQLHARGRFETPQHKDVVSIFFPHKMKSLKMSGTICCLTGTRTHVSCS